MCLFSLSFFLRGAVKKKGVIIRVKNHGKHLCGRKDSSKSINKRCIVCILLIRYHGTKVLVGTVCVGTTYIVNKCLSFHLSIFLFLSFFFTRLNYAAGVVNYTHHNSHSQDIRCRTRISNSRGDYFRRH